MVIRVVLMKTFIFANLMFYHIKVIFHCR